MTARAYEVRVAADDYQHATTVYGESVAKVRYRALLNIRDCIPSLSFRHIRVRFLGVQVTPLEIAERKAARFNALYPVGTRVQVHPFIDDDEWSYCTVVRSPGAFVLPSGHPVVKVPGDSFAIEAVFPIREGTE